MKCEEKYYEEHQYENVDQIFHPEETSTFNLLSLIFNNLSKILLHRLIDMEDLSEIGTILFDLDGVLVDSISAWHSAFNRTLEDFDREPIERDEFIERHWGRELEDNMGALGLGKEAAEHCRSRYEKNIDLVRIYPGVREVLDSLDKRLGLVTGTPSSATHKILVHFGLEKYFDAVVSGNDVDEPKPSPEPILRACEILNTKPKNAIFIGDTRTDVRASRAAGILIIGVGVEADFRVESPEDLKDKLLELGLLP